MTREIFGLFLIFWGLFLLLSLLTFTPTDPNLNHVTSATVVVENSAGLFGAYLSGMFGDIFGFAAFIWPVLFMALGGGCISASFELRWWRWCGYLLLAICLLTAGAAWDFGIGDIRGGGILGDALFDKTRRYFSPGGSLLLWCFVVLMAVQLSFDISWVSLLRECVRRGMAACASAGAGSAEDGRPGTAACAPAPGETASSATTDGPAVSSGFSRLLPRLATALASFRETWGSCRTRLAAFLARQQQRPADAGACAPTATTPDGGAVRIPSAPAASAPATLSGVAAGEGTGTPLAGDASSRAGTDAPESGQNVAPAGVTEARVESASPLATGTTAGEEGSGPRDVARSAGGASASAVSTAGEDLTPASVSAGAGAADPCVVTPSLSAAAADPCVVTSSSSAGDTGALAVPVTGAPDAVPLAAAGDGSASLVAAGKDTGSAPAGRLSAVVSTVVSSVSAAASQLVRSARPVPLPDLALLAPPDPAARAARPDMTSRGRALMACLADFDIQGELVRITPGPVVTMFEVRPAPGIRVSRIANLSDDLALALKAVGVRIQAPIPGTDAVGIEVPNERRETVNFRALLESDVFSGDPGPLPMALGMDIAGRPFSADLSRMPHLLVAGATGAGKSVCLNAILLSLLYRARPDDLQLLLVDPKRIEMAIYADLPHLVHPVVTEMSQAKTALEWAVHEMDQRYEAMARLGVRNISGYNQKLRAQGASLPPECADLTPLPYLVIVIDELADLMLTAAREVETSIVRLAQLARAAGIHMILATQRPSVDVVTGLIKANFPCRISFQVTSKHDSRTILDMVGAEYLLGKGDMLFKPSGGRLLRLHGPFVSDEEVAAVVGHWKRHLPPSYKVDFTEWATEASGGGTGGSGGDAAQDPLYGEVQSFVNDQGKASISLVQRRFKIGFNRAARLVEQLERDGIIGPADGSKPRTVVR